VTIIWASQSETSAELQGTSVTGASCRGSDLGVWGSIVSSSSRVWAQPRPPAIFSYIQIKS